MITLNSEIGIINLWFDINWSKFTTILVNIFCNILPVMFFISFKRKSLNITINPLLIILYLIIFKMYGII